MLHLGDFNAEIEYRDGRRLQQLSFNSFVMETLSILWAVLYILVILLVLVITGLQSEVQIACHYMEMCVGHKKIVACQAHPA